MEFLMEQKQQITEYLNHFLKTSGNDLDKINTFGSEVTKDLYNFSIRGKMIRGSLVTIGAESTGNGADKEDITATGAALELLQSALLIHDDIMDRDTERRGKPSLFAEYGNKLKARNARDYYHTGESLGICAGDIAFFQAFEIISLLKADHETKLKLFRLFSKEMSIVGTAQMQDVRNGAETEFPDEEQILNLYRFKTGRYTFSLPLLAGAILAGADNEQLFLLETIGELMGIIFQIKDDELGLFGDPAVTGKPVGSDILEGKKTLHMELLRRQFSPELKAWFDDVIGNNSITDEDVQAIMAMLQQLGIRQKLANYAKTYVHQIKELLNDLPDTANSAKENLFILLHYILNRNK